VGTKYAYEDLSPEQFEKLVVLICQKLLGIAVQGFATGPDGGRDAKFNGSAELYPSTASPWTGKTVIQAKHTNGISKSFSDTDFFNLESSSTVVQKEIPRIQNLRKSKNLDNYILFSNRKLTGNADISIIDCISEECKIPQESVALIGIEQIELYLKRYPEIVQMAEIDPVDSPLIVSPDDLAEIVEALSIQTNSDRFQDVPPVPRVSLKEKNRINNMSEEYAKESRRRYLSDTPVIKAFLASPENEDYLRMYESIVEEFGLKIISRRNDFQTFDRLMVYLIDLLFNHDAVLRQRKHQRLTRAVLFYMYWNCDIGEVADA